MYRNCQSLIWEMRENKTWTKPWSFGQLRKWEIEEAITGKRTKHQYELRCLINVFQCMFTGKLFMWTHQKVSFRGNASLENTVPLEIYNAHRYVTDQNSFTVFFFSVKRYIYFQDNFPKHIWWWTLPFAQPLLTYYKSSILISDEHIIRIYSSPNSTVNVHRKIAKNDIAIR